MLALVEFASSVISLASAGSIVLFLAIQKNTRCSRWIGAGEKVKELATYQSEIKALMTAKALKDKAIVKKM
ncbi:hypothetical protein P8452_43896 [Trifolium repens]|nr:hypothetical protein P8452_43896 [Trifolium repens]